MKFRFVTLAFMLSASAAHSAPIELCASVFPDEQYEDQVGGGLWRELEESGCRDCKIISHDCTGEFTWPSGTKFKGKWRHLIISWSDEYKSWTANNGPYINDVINAVELESGILSRPDGEFLKGDFLNYNLQGFGTYKARGNTYVGNFKKGRLDGAFDVEYANGDSYSGTFYIDSRFGFGTYVWNDGSKYSGEWYDGMPTRSGTHRSPDGSIVENVIYKIHPPYGEDGMRLMRDGYLTYERRN